MRFETKPDHNQLVFEAIGTKWQLTFEGKKTLNNSKEIIATIVTEFDNYFSRFKKDSVISKLGKKSGSYNLSHPELLDFYKQLYECTDGLMTPAIGTQLVEAGYDSSYSFRSSKLSAVQDWLKVVTWTNDSLTTSEPILLDVGAAGKGLLIDLLAASLPSCKTINAGGDIRTKNIIKVGLEDPENHIKVLGVVQLKNTSLCASSFSRRDWGKFHHIINPITKESPRNTILASWVIADNAMMADGLATSLFFVPPNQLLSHFTFEYAILTTDRKLVRSEGFDLLHM